MSKMDLLRLVTTGSVDDGKSTLIGRLLYDTGSIYLDQLEALSKKGALNKEGIDLAMVTDGLKAEREQGITIDVAYRHFMTKKRRFIIADAPGHVEYTRNMVTGASTAQVALLLLDAQNGLTTQTRRHAFIASLLEIRHLLLAINKMDLVNYSEERFNELKEEFNNFALRLNFADVTFIPISALKGDNVAVKSDNMPWYRGQSVLNYLENVYIEADRNLRDMRFDIELTLRCAPDFRGYAGRVLSGVLRVGDEVLALPSKQKSSIKSITTYNERPAYAFAPQNVAIELNDELDVGRGAMLVRPDNQPQLLEKLDLMVVWLGEKPLELTKSYYVRHLSAEVRGRVDKIYYNIDPDTLHRRATSALNLNDIGRLGLTLYKPLPVDSYEQNRVTGHLILIDPDTNATVAACMVLARNTAGMAEDGAEKLAAAPAESGERRFATGAKTLQKAKTIWLTGLSGAGKSTIAAALMEILSEYQLAATVLDGDVIRKGISAGLGFSEADRLENIRRVAEVARLLNSAGVLAICALISPMRAGRELARRIIGPERFIEAYVNTPLHECQKRDPKGLYKKGISGEIAEFTGVSAPYEEPLAPELVLDTLGKSPKELVEEILDYLAGSH